MKRTLSTLLLAALLISAFAACGEKPAGNTGDSAVTTAAETAAETEADIFEGLSAKTYGGKDYVILVREGVESQFYAEEETGELLNDAVYRRNMQVEDRLGAKISIRSEPGGWDQQGSFLKLISSSVAADEGAYNLVDGYAAYIGNALANGNFVDLTTVPYIDLTKEWWASTIMETMSINGKVYLSPSDITTNLWSSIFCMMFNQTYADNYGIESPYTWVKDGTWTYNKMLDLTKYARSDVDGNGEFDQHDSYPLIFNNSLALNNFHEAFNIPTTKLDEEGFPVSNLADPRIEWLITEAKELIYDNENVYIASLPAFDWRSISHTDYLSMFSDNRAFLMTALLGFSSDLRDMKSDYGIIPYPKYDEKQERYQTYAMDTYSLLGIPADVKDIDFTGCITEALARVSNDTVIPTYMETMLKEKYARDEDTILMIDIIRDGLTLDFGVVFSSQLERAGWHTRDCLEFDYEYASYLKKMEKKYIAAFDAFLQKFR